ncbi:hypothetical protein M422DRAFT_38427 [Sphaerobolus stellatus SS14]|uniref:non-specific serine/threonine protein kinase n=1 Tax=Sphaerobolus stellatus (strain SS14) TaxID=990650 RepID=A0A0C9UL66_SPHS4|nr:hypothetical protein M422DRAFT_38427 [Sphaerobolus stellatus SS14]
MTDTPSGLKRPREGDHEREWKRRREDEERDRSRQRDRRDVHLMESRRMSRDSSRDRHRDRRGRGGCRDDYRRDSRDDRDSDRDRARDRPRDRNRDRGRERGRERGKIKERETQERYSRSRSHPLREVERKPANGNLVKDRDSEMEEGEISPTRTPPREPSRHRSVSYVSTPHPLHRDSEPLHTTSERGHASERKAAEAPKPQESLEPQPELELATQEEEKSVEQIMEERRRRRAAILAKYAREKAAMTPSSTSTPDRGVTPSAAVQPLVQRLTIEDQTGSRESSVIHQETGTASATVRSNSRSASPTHAEDMGHNLFDLTKDGSEEQADKITKEDGEQISAADYDPSLDRREDEARRVGIWNGQAKANGKEDKMDVDVVEEEVTDEEDEDVEDMFAIATSEPKKKKKVKKISVMKPVIATTTMDTAADPEGYYQIILGEQLDGARYQVFSSLGKGIFSNVVRARVISGEGSETGKEVAIKIVRAQESMHRAGLKEVQILNKLRQADPDDKKHIVRLERTFEHRGHLCLVFENLSMNLRDLIKRFGKEIGLNIRAMFLALSLLRKCNIMHADIKPDNILVSENKAMLKVCDFGSASDITENEITPYLVSRFYRAPEIILGLPYDGAIDVWSIGCTLYELYTGKILFPGRSNNQMLLFMMELKGRFNSKMIKKAKFGEVYFDDVGGFLSLERDKVTGADVTRTVHMSKPTRDLRARLAHSSSQKMKDNELKMVMSFIDLLEKCLVLDPARRLTSKDALMHPFIRGV